MTAFFSKRVIATIDLQQLNYAQLNNPYKTKCYAHNEIKKKTRNKNLKEKNHFSNQGDKNYNANTNRSAISSQSL